MPSRETAPPPVAHQETHRRELTDFCAGLPDRDGRFFMFFTSGLLHWTLQSSRLVPRGVDLVLIGGGLTDEEAAWCRESLDRPFHHVRAPVDDKTIWELLFATQERHFGWLDIDCFVLDPGLFDEMRALEPGRLANTIWSGRGPGDRPILRTYFLYLGSDAVREIGRGMGVSPSVHSFEPSRRGRTEPDATTTPIGPELEEVLREALGTGADGRPPYLTQEDFYDTLQVFQLAAESRGYRLHRVRDLADDENLPEVVHLGRVSYYSWAWGGSTLPENRHTMRVIAQADFLVLNRFAEHLPPRYRDRLRSLRTELPSLGLPTDLPRLREMMIRALVAEGVAEEAAHRMLASP